MTIRSDYRGPALFSGGFRPFFLAAMLFAIGVIPAWYLAWRGEIALGGPFPAVDWHIHEMIFGYGAAVVAGFLFTAVPNWTGRLPTRGWPLAGLLALWVAGRLALAGAFPLPPTGVLAIDQAFLLAVVAMIAREIVAGKNWRNLKVLVPVTLLWAANLAFHAEVQLEGTCDLSRRAGTALLIFLIMLIGGRIVPSFTRNWLAKAGAQRMPVPFNRFDGLCIGAGTIALVVWCVLPDTPLAGFAAAAAAGLHLGRLARWRGMASWRSPLLLMLHAAYLMIPLGFVSVAAAAAGLAGPDVPSHLFGIGAIGGMTVAVMMRASLGHTGRNLVAGPWLTASFVLVLLAALARLAGYEPLLKGIDGISLAAVFWTVAFALLATRLAPWLLTDKAAARAPNARVRTTAINRQI
ncbi:NnrS family protein [Tropicimonas aquimaris]|uniref:NnrS family protein n=1 Tax=Tropicimonas aquimaris TaxID=914152 RepID=A0ABW3IVA4_9RHOB